MGGAASIPRRGVPKALRGSGTGGGPAVIDPADRRADRRGAARKTPVCPFSFSTADATLHLASTANADLPRPVRLRGGGDSARCRPIPGGRATPAWYGWDVWVGGPAWLAQHFWWHYEFSLDAQFLRRRAYPFFREVAAFYASYLVEDEGGTLQIVPSQSPENRFAGGGDLPVTLCVSATADVLLARQVLGYARRAAELLGVDEDKRRSWGKRRHGCRRSGSGASAS